MFDEVFNSSKHVQAFPEALIIHPTINPLEDGFVQSSLSHILENLSLQVWTGTHPTHPHHSNNP
jgi:hypothetical protein